MADWKQAAMWGEWYGSEPKTGNLCRASRKRAMFALRILMIVQTLSVFSIQLGGIDAVDAGNVPACRCSRPSWMPWCEILASVKTFTANLEERFRRSRPYTDASGRVRYRWASSEVDSLGSVVWAGGRTTRL